MPTTHNNKNTLTHTQQAPDTNKHKHNKPAAAMSDGGSSGGSSSGSESSASEDNTANEQHVHQVVTGANADPQVLQYFWDLASLEQVNDDLS